MNNSRNLGDKRAEPPGAGTVAQKKKNASVTGTEELKAEKYYDDDSGKVETPFDLSIPTLPGGDKQAFDFTISGLGEKPGPVNYKICGMITFHKIVHNSVLQNSW